MLIGCVVLETLEDSPSALFRNLILDSLAKVRRTLLNFLYLF